jgi:Ca-activated chloride channel homolog
MRFAWPTMFASLAILPVLAWWYRRLVQRRAERASALAAQGFRPSAASASLNNKRHIPFVFFFAALLLLLVALARPQRTISVPNRQGTVILAFDVSNSMRADDLKPTRIEAAKVAAKQFVDKQPKEIKVGVVAFSDGAIATQQPSNDKTAIKASIDRLSATGSTSLGQGLLASLGMISGKPISVDPNAVAADGAPIDADGPFAGIDIGYFGSAAIVLLSDGEDRSEIKPADLAKLASTSGVKIYPIGIGSTEGTVVEIDGFQLSTALNEESLQELAKLTDGKYFNAADTAALAKVYSSIDLEWKREPKLTEITAILAAISSALLVIGAACSLFWFGRVV